MFHLCVTDRKARMRENGTNVRLRLDGAHAMHNFKLFTNKTSSVDLSGVIPPRPDGIEPRS
jgi:hypothetical protein